MPLPAAVVHGIAHPPTAPSEPPGASENPSTIISRSRCAQSMNTDLEQLVDEFIKIALFARGQSLSLPVRENRNSIEMTSHPDVDDIPLRGDPADRIQDPPRARPVESPHAQLPDESSLQIVLGHDRLNNLIPLH